MFQSVLLLSLVLGGMDAPLFQVNAPRTEFQVNHVGNHKFEFEVRVVEPLVAPEELPPEPLKPIVEAPRKPVIDVYTGDKEEALRTGKASCKPCLALYRAEKGGELSEYRIRWHFEEIPAWADGTPALWWNDSAGGGRRVIGWLCTDHFKRVWNTTEKLVKDKATRKAQKTRAAQRATKDFLVVCDKFRGYMSHWTWPGRLDWHLRVGHGIDPSGMTPGQQRAWHDAWHDKHGPR